MRGDDEEESGGSGAGSGWGRSCWWTREGRESAMNNNKNEIKTENSYMAATLIPPNSTQLHPIAPNCTQLHPRQPIHCAQST
jgi:hypothetical protein